MGWASLSARGREKCPQAVQSHVRRSSKKVRVRDSCNALRPMAIGSGCVERCRARSSLEPGVKPFLRDCGVAGLAVEVVVGLSERVGGLLEQSFAFRTSRWSWLKWPRAWGPIGRFHLVGDHVNQVAPFRDAGGELLEMCIELYPCLVVLHGVSRYARQGVSHVVAQNLRELSASFDHVGCRGVAARVVDFHR